MDYLSEFVESETAYLFEKHKLSATDAPVDGSSVVGAQPRVDFSGDFFGEFLKTHFSPEELALLPEVRTKAETVLQAKLEALAVYKRICLQRNLACAVPAPEISDSAVAIHAVLTPPSAQLEAVAAAVAEVGGTRRLSVRSFAYTDAAVASLLRASAGPERRPVEISLTDCLLGERAMDALFRHHADPAGMELETLSLIRCGLGQPVAASSRMGARFRDFLASEFSEDQTQTEEWGVPVSLPLFLFVRYSWSLRRLDLSGNLLPEAATRLLGWALCESAGAGSLEQLVLDECGLTSASLAPVSAGLGKNRSLQELSLQQNVGVRELGEFCRRVATHSRLSHLKLQGVRVGDVEAFWEMLQKSSSLVAVHAFGLIGDSCTVAPLLETLRLQTHAGPVVASSQADDGREMVFYRVPQLPTFERWRVAWEGKSLARDCFSNECHVCGNFLRHDFVYCTNHPRVMTVGLVASFAPPNNVLDLQRTATGFIVSLLVPPGKHFYAFCINGDLTRLTVARQEFFVRTEPDKMHQLGEWEALKHAEFVNVIETASAGQTRGLGKARNATEYATEAAEARVEESKNAMKRCMEGDMDSLNLPEICGKLDEPDLRKMILARYSLVNEVFTIFAAKNRNFPIIKQSNVARFFEICELVETESLFNKKSAISGTGISDYQGVLNRQEIQQIIDQTFAAAEQSAKDELAALDFQQRILVELSRIRKEKLAKTVQRPVTRGKFLEILLRASVCVQAKVRKIKTLAEQFAYICDKIIEPIFVRPPLAPFSRAQLAHPEIVKLLTRLIPDSTVQDERSLFRQIFLRYGDSQDSFIRLAHVLRLQDKVFTTDDVRAVFSLSKIPQQVGLALDNPRLTYQEFVEAFCRLAIVYKFQKTQRSTGSSKQTTSSLSAVTGISDEHADRNPLVHRWRKAVGGAGEKGEKQIDTLAKNIEMFFDFTVSKMRSAINHV